MDEFGPLNLQPRPGRAWRPQGQPVRLRATYTRDQGVRHMIAALDLTTGKLHYRPRRRFRSASVTGPEWDRPVAVWMVTMFV